MVLLVRRHIYLSILLSYVTYPPISCQGHEITFLALWDFAWFLSQGLCPHTPIRNYRSLTLFFLNAQRSKHQKFLVSLFSKRGQKELDHARYESPTFFCNCSGALPPNLRKGRLSFEPVPAERFAVGKTGVQGRHSLLGRGVKAHKKTLPEQLRVVCNYSGQLIYASFCPQDKHG